MPEYPVLSGAEVIRALQRLGFERVRQKGSHVTLHRGSDKCVIPLHKEVRRGTLGAIIRQARVTPAEFLSAIER